MKLWFVVPLDDAGKLKPSKIRVCFSPLEALCTKLELLAAGIKSRVIISFVCGSGY